MSTTKNEATINAALAPGRRDRAALLGRQAQLARDELCAMRAALGNDDPPLDHLLMGAIRALGMAEHYCARTRDHLKAIGDEAQLSLDVPYAAPFAARERADEEQRARREDAYVTERDEESDDGR